jgi:hypothetical protein
VNSLTLNVLIHGMYVIDVADRDVTLYAPDVPHCAHVYRAGTWMKEQDLARGSQHRLTGFARPNRPDLAALQPDRNAVFQRQTLNPKLAFCSIVVPFPDSISPLRLTYLRDSVPFFEGAPALHKAPSALPDVVVLTYNDVKGQPGLEPLHWTPDVQNGIANLHIWAVPPGATPPAHPAEALITMGQLMGYQDLRMNQIYANQPAPAADPQPGVPGVSSNEELSLYERQQLEPTPAGTVTPAMTSAFNCLSTFVY